MKILIVGASGLVGENIFKYFRDNSKWSVFGTYNTFSVKGLIHFNASDINTWTSEVVNSQWDAIVHTGALTNVDLCEDDPESSYERTVVSTQNLISLAKSNNAKFIYISTDYVFDGRKGLYSENDEVSPLNVYGKHKLEAERLIIEMLPNNLVLRITNVYGDEQRGKNYISRILKQLESNDIIEVNAPFDQYATPINALDVAKAIYLLLRDDKRGVYHLASTDYMNRVQLLKKISQYTKKRIIINPISTSALGQKALRPVKGGFSCLKFLNEYNDFSFTNIDDYLKNRI